MNNQVKDSELDFCIEEYQTNNTAQKKRAEAIEEFKRLALEQKILKHKQVQLAMQISDPEKTKAVKSAVNIVHKAILNSIGNTPNQDLDTILDNCFKDKEDLMKALTEAKNNNFYSGVQIFEENSTHPIQKKLKRAKFLSKNRIKKAKTPMQYLKILLESKQNYENAMETKLLREKLNKLEIQQQLTNLKLEDVSSTLGNINANIKDFRQLTAYWIYTNNKEQITYQELADMLEVSTRTVKRWVAEVDKILNSQK